MICHNGGGTDNNTSYSFITLLLTIHQPVAQTFPDKGQIAIHTHNITQITRTDLIWKPKHTDQILLLYESLNFITQYKHDKILYQLISCSLTANTSIL